MDSLSVSPGRSASCAPALEPVSASADIAATSGISTAALWAAVGALATFLGTQAKAFGELDSAFPDGKWPDSQASSFSDASVDADNKSNWKIL